MLKNRDILCKPDPPVPATVLLGSVIKWMLFLTGGRWHCCLPLGRSHRPCGRERAVGGGCWGAAPVPPGRAGELPEGSVSTLLALASWPGNPAGTWTLSLASASCRGKGPSCHVELGRREVASLLLLQKVKPVRPGPWSAGGPGTAVLLLRHGNLRSATPASHLPGHAAVGNRLPMLIPVPCPSAGDEEAPWTSPPWCPRAVQGARAPHLAGRARHLPCPSASSSPGLVAWQSDVAAQNRGLGWGCKGQGRPDCPSVVRKCHLWLGKVMISLQPVIDMRLFINILCSE